jgi:hypothetical protein
VAGDFHEDVKGVVSDQLNFQKREARQQLRFCLDVRRKDVADQQDAIDITGFVDVGNEAPVDYKLLYARPPRCIVQPSDRVHLRPAQLRRSAETLANFLDAGGMESRR